MLWVNRKDGRLGVEAHRPNDAAPREQRRLKSPEGSPGAQVCFFKVATFPPREESKFWFCSLMDQYFYCTRLQEFLQVVSMSWWIKRQKKVHTCWS